MSFRYYPELQRYCGQVPLGITSAWDNCPSFFSGLWMAVTMIDSSHVSQSGGSLTDGGIAWVEVGGAIVIEPDSVGEVFARGRTFYHFDEVFLFASFPDAILFPDQHWTSEVASFSSVLPDEFVRWFLRLGSLRYLSDGCGLNFCCESLELAECLAGLADNPGADFPG